MEPKVNMADVKRLREQRKAQRDSVVRPSENLALNDESIGPEGTGQSTAPRAVGAEAPTPEQPMKPVQRLEAIAQELAPRQESAAARSARLMREIEQELPCFQDQFGNFFALYAGGAKREYVSLNSERFTDLVRVIAIQRGGQATHIPKEHIDGLRSICRHVALQKSPVTVYRRIGKDGDDYLYDLGDGTQVRTNATGSTIEQNRRHPFRWSREQAVTPPPVLCADPAIAFGRLAPMLVGIPIGDQLPVIAAVIEYLRCDTPHPILQLLGMEGSMKSSVAERIIRAVDNFGSDEPPSTELERKDIIASAQAHLCIFGDNVTDLPKGVEDLLCIAALGGAQTSRLFYTNAEVHTAPLHNPIIFTGIQPLLRQSDALDRAYTIFVERPTMYRPMREVRAEFTAAIPEILGALLCLLSTALRKRDAVAQVPGISKHRMIDWMMTGEAIAQALGHPVGHFVTLMHHQRQVAAKDYIEGDTFAAALVSILHHWVDSAQQKHQDYSELPSWRTWAKKPGWVVVTRPNGTVVAATPAAICNEISTHAGGAGFYRNPRIPNTARATTGALQRVQGVLTRSGINCQRQSVNGGHNGYWLFAIT
ncbi:MAG: hypothetical protein WAT23_18295 [Chromatiaceae bacterium]